MICILRCLSIYCLWYEIGPSVVANRAVVNSYYILKLKQSNSTEKLLNVCGMTFNIGKVGIT